MYSVQDKHFCIHELKIQANIIIEKKIITTYLTHDSVPKYGMFWLGHFFYYLMNYFISNISSNLI